MPPGPALFCWPDEMQGCSPECCHRQEVGPVRGGASSENPWTSVWSQAEAQTRDIHMVFQISIQNPAVGVAVDTDPRVSSSTSLHNAQNVLLLFLYHLSTTYLYIVLASSEVGPRSWGRGPLCVYSQLMLCGCGLAPGCPPFICANEYRGSGQDSGFPRPTKHGVT